MQQLGGRCGRHKRREQAMVSKQRVPASPVEAVADLVARVRRETPKRSPLFETRAQIAHSLAARLEDAETPPAPIARELAALLDLIAAELVVEADDADMP
jgi:hypothetical protein